MNKDYHPVLVTDNWKYFYLMPTKISKAYWAMSESSNIQVGDLIEYALVTYMVRNKNLKDKVLWVNDDGD